MYKMSFMPQNAHKLCMICWCWWGSEAQQRVPSHGNYIYCWEVRVLCCLGVPGSGPLYGVFRLFQVFVTLLSGHRVQGTLTRCAGIEEVKLCASLSCQWWSHAGSMVQAWCHLWRKMEEDIMEVIVVLFSCMEKLKPEFVVSSLYEDFSKYITTFAFVDMP